MSSFLGNRKLVKGGLVALDATSGAVKRTIALQYHPDTLTRSYQVQGACGDGGAERAQPLHRKGPAIELIQLDAEIDAADQLEPTDKKQATAPTGIRSQRAALATTIHPTSSQRQFSNTRAFRRTVER